MENFKQSSDVTFKVARKNSCTADLVDTIQYFLAKFPNVKTVFFHGGTNDMKSGHTEVLKAEYQRLMTMAFLSDVKLVLSGPIPDLQMGVEAFSRTVSLNNWLTSFVSQENLIIVDNFDKFWRKPNLFLLDKQNLSTAGYQLLERNIMLALQL